MKQTILLLPLTITISILCMNDTFVLFEGHILHGDTLTPLKIGDMEQHNDEQTTNNSAQEQTSEERELNVKELLELHDRYSWLPKELKREIMHHWLEAQGAQPWNTEQYMLLLKNIPYTKEEAEQLHPWQLKKGISSWSDNTVVYKTQEGQVSFDYTYFCEDFFEKGNLRIVGPNRNGWAFTGRFAVNVQQRMCKNIRERLRSCFTWHDKFRLKQSNEDEMRYHFSLCVHPTENTFLFKDYTYTLSVVELDKHRISSSDLENREQIKSYRLEFLPLLHEPKFLFGPGKTIFFHSNDRTLHSFYYETKEHKHFDFTEFFKENYPNSVTLYHIDHCQWIPEYPDMMLVIFKNDAHRVAVGYNINTGEIKKLHSFRSKQCYLGDNKDYYGVRKLKSKAPPSIGKDYDSVMPISPSPELLQKLIMQIAIDRWREQKRVH